VDDLVAQGKEPGVSCGVPVSMKVNVDELGHATTNGLSLQRNLIAQSDSPVVSNTRAAGGVIVGRSNTLQGSSSSAATAVASGMCALGHRTVRCLAFACGVHGLRPTLGRVPAYSASSNEPHNSYIIEIFQNMRL